MKYLFFSLLFQISFFQAITAQTDPNPPASVQFKSFGNGALYKTEQTATWAEGTVSGSILNKNGVPLVNAYVLCGKRGARTDENGAYRITKIEAGAYYLAVTTCLIEEGTTNHCKSGGAADVFGVNIYPNGVEVEVSTNNPNITQDFSWGQ